jgi:hypothetical protein
MIKAINEATGEVIELPTNTLEEVVNAWQIAQQYDKAATSLKDQLKELVPKYLSDNGRSDEVSNYQFKSNTVQRMTYDKTVLRQQLDEDVFDLMMKPDKQAVDKYLKENIEVLGDASTVIRQAMITDGKPYQVIKLEKLSR